MQNVYVKQFHHCNNKYPTNFPKKKLLSNFQDNTITPRFKRPVTGTLLWNSLPLVPEKGIQDHFLFKLKTKVFKYQPGARILLGSSYS